MNGRVNVLPGAQLLIDEPHRIPSGSRVGVLVNPTSILPDFRHLADCLIDREDIKVTAIFGPEHGVFSTAQDQIGVEAGTYRGIPVFSLYDGTRDGLAPDEATVGELDILIFDIQDIGSRYYTYVWTMLECMEVCAKKGVAMIVCDRPNPIGGLTIEGPMLQEEFLSFVGRHPLCTRHGMTAGEIAMLCVKERNIDVDLTVLRCRGWRRDLWIDRTSMVWFMPSPNMPTLETATVYPGGCLIEGTNLSEGRGTTRPFEMIGAPYVDGNVLAEALNKANLPGVFFRPVSFEPTFQKHAGRVCNGVFPFVIDRDDFRPVYTYLQLIATARALSPDEFDWRREPYEFEEDRLAIDLLFGTDQVRKAIEAGISPVEIAAGWRDDESVFRARREPFLLYNGTS